MKGKRFLHPVLNNIPSTQNAHKYLDYIASTPAMPTASSYMNEIPTKHKNTITPAHSEHLSSQLIMIVILVVCLVLLFVLLFLVFKQRRRRSESKGNQ